MNEKKAARSLAILALLLGLAFVTGIVPGAIKPVRAYAVPNSCVGTVSGTSQTCTTAGALTVANAGDLLILGFEAHDNGPSSPISVTDVTGTLGETWLLAASALISHPSNTSCSSACFDDEVWYAIAPSSGSDTITVVTDDSTNSGGITAIDVTGISSPIAFEATVTTYYSGTGVYTFPTTNSLSFSSNTIPFSSLTNDCENGNILSHGTGYTSPNVQPGGSIWGASEYGTPLSPPSSPTNFNWSCAPGSITAWINVGVIFGTQTKVVQVNACTAFQLQCWLYPIFVFGIYMGLVGGIAMGARVPTRDITGHFLEAFSFAAMVCVLMGILNIMVPLLVTVLQVIRAIRE